MYLRITEFLGFSGLGQIGKALAIIGSIAELSSTLSLIEISGLQRV